MTRVYKNNFRFIANRYEEWQAGRCISHGPIRTEILAEVSENSIHFELNEIDELRILQSFDFMCSDAASAILRDRVQYSNATSDFNPIVPIVCHLFYSGDRIEYVRFAMTNPDRLIEFYGDMIELGQPSTGVRTSSSNNIAVTADDIMEELDGYGMLNVDTIMERATRLYNDNANVRTIDEAEKVSESLKLFVEAYNLEREKMEEDDKDYSVWMPKILMFIALSNYKIGNINSAYYIAKKALDEIDNVEENSMISGVPRDMYGESTINELISIIETQHWDDVDEEMDVDDVDETEIDLDNFYNMKCKAERDARTSGNPEATRISQIVEVVDKVQSQYWEAGAKSGNLDMQMQYHNLFNIIKNALYYCWEKLGCGHHSDFWKEGDSMFDYMMFELGPEERINAIINLLEESSPFAPIERNSAITNALLSIFRRVV